MKKSMAFLLALVMTATLMFSGSALALGYSNRQGNKAGIETLEEARANSAAVIPQVVGSTAKYVPHPALDAYPEGKAYVYRSENVYGGQRAAARLNTVILVFADDKSIVDKATAEAYLQKLGVIDMINEAVGSVILVTPADAEKGFGAQDQKNYYALQTAIFSQKTGGVVNGENVTYSDAEYYGGLCYTYLIGIDGGATFVNNYVSTVLDYQSRLAGMLLINGTMDAYRKVAGIIPTYLVNAPEAVAEKYQAINDVDTYEKVGNVETYYNKALPLQRVSLVAGDTADPAAYVQDAYYGMFVNAMRSSVQRSGMNSASSPYQGYGLDATPYSLCARNAVTGGVTEDGIHVSMVVDSTTFADIKTVDGLEFLETWYEFLPDEVFSGTAPAGSVPLILAMHGMGDDPFMFVDETGLLDLAGSERFAIVAPEHQGIFWTRVDKAYQEGILLKVIPLFVKHILAKYPQLDPARVYVTGYSMGGFATFKSIHSDPSLFAAAVPMSGMGYSATELEAAQFDTIDMPIMVTTSTNDLSVVFDASINGIGSSYQTQIPLFLQYNGMEPLPAFDFAKYPMSGFEADAYRRVTLNNEFVNHTWILNNDAGVPMVGLSITEGLVHSLYPEFGKLAWNFLKHYARGENGEVLYTANVE